MTLSASYLRAERGSRFPFVRVCIGLFCLILPTALLGQKRGEQGTTESCREFVSSFYDWYAPIARRNNPGPSSDIALQEKPNLFTKELVSQLQEESEVQKKAGSDLVGLDADPFLGADGAGERYVIERITAKENICWAEVHAVWDGKEDVVPDVTPQLVYVSGKWVFMNFYFPSPSSPDAWNLLSGLKKLRESWRKYGLLKDQKH